MRKNFVIVTNLFVTIIILVSRPSLTDCGALGKLILGGPQIKVKTKKQKKKKKKGHSHFLQPFHTYQCHQQYSYPNTAAK